MKNPILIFTNHFFQRYQERILVSNPQYRVKLEKIFGSQNWMEHLLLAELLHSELVTGQKELEVIKNFCRGGSRTTWEENYGKSWTYLNKITGNVFLCAQENPYLVALTCFKFDEKKCFMNTSKWFYETGMKSLVYKKYFSRVKETMSEYGIKSLFYKNNEIGYLK